MIVNTASDGCVEKGTHCWMYLGRHDMR
jgi:hypothetical protein